MFLKKNLIVQNQKITISIKKANLYGLLFIPVLGSLLFFYYSFWSFPNLKPHINSPKSILFFLFVILLSVIIHELIHGLFFIIFAKKSYKSVKIGFLWKHLTPYAHCKEPLKKKYYLTSVLMPGILLGLTPMIIGFLFGYFFLFVFGLFSTLAAGGDFIIFALAYKISADKELLDHPSECGFFIIDKPI